MNRQEFRAAWTDGHRRGVMERGKEALRGMGELGPKGRKEADGPRSSRVLGNLPLEEDVRLQTVRTASNCRLGRDPEPAGLDDLAEMVPGYSLCLSLEFDIITFLWGVQVPGRGESCWRVCVGGKRHGSLWGCNKRPS